jgi:hypothetical protein
MEVSVNEIVTLLVARLRTLSFANESITSSLEGRKFRDGGCCAATTTVELASNELMSRRRMRRACMAEDNDACWTAIKFAAASMCGGTFSWIGG